MSCSFIKVNRLAAMPNQVLFRYFTISPVIIRLAVLLYAKLTLVLPTRAVPKNMLLRYAQPGMIKMKTKGKVQTGLDTRIGPN